jgi:hypothetical protein
MPKKERQSLVEDQNPKTPRNIYNKLHHIQSKIGQLEKTRENKFQKYFYAGEYDLLKAIKPLLAEQQLLLIFSDEINETHPLWKEQIGKEWLVHYLKKAQLINAENNSEQLTYYFWAMAQNTDLAKAKGSAETYAIKYFLQKFFLIPTDNNLDPDAFDSKEVPAKTINSSSQTLDQSLTELQSQTNTISIKEVESLINLFRQKTADSKERQTNFLTELDQQLAKREIAGTTNAGNFRARLAILTPVDYQYLCDWLLKLEDK